MRTAAYVLIFVALLHGSLYLAMCEICHVCPDRNQYFNSCLTLSRFANTSITSNTTLIFIGKNHYLTKGILVSNVTAFSMISESINASINCLKGTNLTFSNVGKVYIRDITFIGCGGNTIDSVKDLKIEHSHFQGQNSSATSILIIESNASITDTHFLSNINGTYRYNVGRFGLIHSLDSRSSSYTSVGGALIITHSTLAVDKCLFQGNAANNGGAIFSELESTITIRNSKFYFNHAIDCNDPQFCSGGALFIEGVSTVNVHNCSFENNTSNGDGGIIYVYNASLVLFNSNVSNNNALINGGAVYAYQKACLKFNTSRFNGNGASKDGGVAYLSESNATINHCVFTQNKADGNGGSLVNRNSQIVIYSSNFIFNFATDGGVIFNEVFGKVCVFGSNFSNNTAYDDGGVVHTNNQCNFTQCVFFENSAVHKGGVLYANASRSILYYVHVLIQSSSFHTNMATKGGVLYIKSQINIAVNDCTFYGNNRTDRGGVIFAHDRTHVVINNSIFMKNSAHFGGVLTAHRNSTVSIENCSFSSNRALDSGGTIYAQTSSMILISNSSFLENRANDDGIVLVSDSSNVTMENSTFVGNVASHDGGAAHVYDDSTILVHCCTFDRNRADNSGGAIYGCNNVSITVKNSSMYSNSAQAAGGGIYAQKDCHTIIKISNFTNNTAECGGAAYACVNTSVKLFTSTFTRNWAKIAGGALATYKSSEITVKRCSFTFNMALTGGVSVAFQNAYTYKCLHHMSETCDNVQVKKSMITFYESRFWNNKAHKSGVLYAEGSIINVKNSSFHKNYAEFFGGVIFATMGSIISIDYTIFTDNKAMYKGGVLAVTHNTSISISHSNFTRNRAHNDGGVVYMRRSNARIYSSQFNFSFSGETGGVLAAVVAGSVQIESSYFENNRGTHEGGVLHASSNSTLTITCSYFVNNTSTGSGGVLHQNENSNSTITNCLFLLNRATHDGGVISSSSSSISITNSTFNNNSAKRGAALALVQNSSVLFEVKTNAINCSLFVCSDDVNGSISNRFFGTETTFSHNQASEKGGALRISDSFITFGSRVHISSNQATSGGGIYAVNSSLFFWNVVCFYGNQASENGGGVSLTESKFYDKNNAAEINFESNKANFGGGIYVDDRGENSLCANNPAAIKFSNASGCFFQNMINNVTIRFVTNLALRGHDLFGGLLDRCTVVSDAEPFKLKPVGMFRFREISNLESYDTVTSKPVRLCLCNKNRVANCSQRTHKVHVKMKNRFPVHIAAVDQVNHTIAATIVSKIKDINLTDRQTIQRIGPECCKLKYHVPFPSIKIYQFYMYPEGPCANKSISLLNISVDVISCTCPLGFMKDDTNINCVCVCDKIFSKYIKECDKKTESVIRKGSFWITYFNRSSANNVSPYFIFPYCPLNYCQSPNKPISVNFNQPNGSDAQCATNRGGFLCGSCLPQYSLSLGSSRCIKCPRNWYGQLIGITLGSLLAGLMLVFLILILNLTVAVGTLNPLIFYANIVYSNKNVYFGKSQLKFIAVFISWLNLNVGVDVCFFDGMDSYAKVWLELVFPIYIIVLVIAIIYISSCSSTFSKRLGKKNPVATLATLILLSYAKLLEVIINSFSFVTVNYPDGTVATKWLPDASVEFNAWKDSALILMGILVLIFGLFYTALILFWQLLLRCPQNVLLKFIRNQKLQTFVEVYHIPYTAKHRYWTGLLLLVRIIVYLISTFTVSLDPRITLLATAVIMSSLLLYKTLLMIKVYKNYLLNAIESFTHFNIAIFAMFTWYGFDDSGDENESLQISTAYISGGTVFALFLLILIFHVYRYSSSKVYSLGKNLKLVKKIQNNIVNLESWTTSRRNSTNNYNVFDFIDNRQIDEYVPPPVHLRQGVSKSVVAITDFDRSECQVAEDNLAEQQLED